MKTKNLWISLILLVALGILVRCGSQLRTTKLIQLKADRFVAQAGEKLHAYEQANTPEKFYLHTDKSLYYPGEDIWWSGYLQAVGHTAADQLSDVVYVELLNPQGSVIQNLNLPILQGKAKGNFSLSKTIAGGLYKLRAYTQWMKNAGKESFFEKQIQVQKAIKPQLLLKLKFKREAYGTNDEVVAELSARNLKDAPVALTSVRYITRLAGQNYKMGAVTTDGKGEALVKVKLPQKLKNNDGLLTIHVNHQGMSESISRSIPIVMGNITLDFFPEGGNWVADIKGNMAFKALNEFGKPADIEGEVIDENGRQIQTFKSYHQGMGAFMMTPAANTGYKVRITKPAGIDKIYSLPKTVANVPTLRIEKEGNKRLNVRIYSPQKDTLYLVAQSGGKAWFSRKVLASGEGMQTIDVQDFPVGIAKITLFDTHKRPQCERLVFVNPHKQLKIQIKTAKKNYQPREKVTAEIRTTNEKDQPVAANLSIAVVDDKILTLADDKQDNLLSYMLMSAELKGKIHEPNFYFKPNESKAMPALDYVMLTHGWRRYEWQQVWDTTIAKKQFAKEKVGVVSGKIVQTDTKLNPVKSKIKVVLYELEGKKRRLETFTDQEGKFMFKNTDPQSSIQLLAQSFAKQKVLYSIYLDKNLRPNSLYNQNSYYSALNKNTTDSTRIYEPSYFLSENEVDVDKKRADIAVTKTKEEIKKLAKDILIVENNRSKPVANTTSNNLPVIQQPEVVEVPNEEEIVDDIEPNLNLEIVDLEYPVYYMDGKRLKYPANVWEVSLENIKAIRFGRVDPSNVHIITKGKASAPKNNKHLKVTTKHLLKIPFAKVKVYRAKEYKSKEQHPKKRTDFRNTIYWNPEVVTNKEGKANITFWNNDALTTFRIVAEGVGGAKLLGRTEQTYFTKLPFELTAKVPPYFSVNDVLQLPIYLANNTDRAIKGLLEVQAPKAFEINEQRINVNLAPQSVKTLYVQGKVARILNKKDEAQLGVQFKSDLYSESYAQNIEVYSKGFPIHESYSGNHLKNSFTVQIPEIEENSLQVDLVAYPNIFNGLMESIASILSRPHGCFEQVSSSTYPNILALQFLDKTGTARPGFRARALDYIADGYKKLAAYETSEKGFEWYGDTPPHEGLSAFGLLEFMAMKQVYPGVSEAMIERTKQWLLSRRDGQGGFKQNSGKYGFAAASKKVNNAYIVYALSEAGVKSIAKEYHKAYQEATQSQDAYRMALLTLAAFNLAKKQDAQTLLAMLRSQLKRYQPGKLKADHSLVRSYGNSLQIETCAFIALAEMRQKQPEISRIQPLIDYIISQRLGGYFGSTQGTILALQALTQYAAMQSQKAQNGTLLVYKGNEQIASLNYSKNQQGQAILKGLEKHLLAESQDITVRFAHQDQIIPFTLNTRYYAITPSASEACNIALKTQLARPEVAVNETVRLTTTIRNKKQQGQASTIALVGIPSGLSPQPWQLKELQERGTVAYYELRKSYVIFYFREMAPGASKTIHLDLKAAIPGTYRAPASSAYLYYTSEHKDWKAGEQITIKSRTVN